MQYNFIDDQTRLEEYCDSLADADLIAFDTEFVSEDTFRPQLCLIQVAAKDELVVIDPLAVDSVECFWRRLAEGEHQTVVHAAREEFLFCFRAIQKRPVNFYDIQIAAGFVGLDYPAAYSKLVDKLFGKSLPKGETRTDWRMRPLSERQLRYALQDVQYLEALRTHTEKGLKQRRRMAWFENEMELFQLRLEDVEQQEQWRRVSGVGGLAPRSLAIVRELWRWREQEAARLDKPARRVLRDDLIVELARRQSAAQGRIKAVRGMNFRGIRQSISVLSEVIQTAMELPEDELPRRPKKNRNNQQYNLLGQFLAVVLNSICRENDMSIGLVGTTQDVRDLIGHHLDGEAANENDLPSLAQGWRAEIVGSRIEQVLRGELAIFVDDPDQEQPLGWQNRTDAD